MFANRQYRYLITCQPSGSQPIPHYFTSHQWWLIVWDETVPPLCSQFLSSETRQALFLTWKCEPSCDIVTSYILDQGWLLPSWLNTINLPSKSYVLYLQFKCFVVCDYNNHPWSRMWDVTISHEGNNHPWSRMWDVTISHEGNNHPCILDQGWLL
jgi:hypothetical protein